MVRVCPKCSLKVNLPEVTFDGQEVVCPSCKSRLSVIYGDLKDKPVLREAEEEKEE